MNYTEACVHLTLFEKDVESKLQVLTFWVQCLGIEYFVNINIMEVRLIWK